MLAENRQAPDGGSCGPIRVMGLPPARLTCRLSSEQQARFDDFLEIYNRERPHQALGMRHPAEICTPSARLYRGLQDLEHPFHDPTLIVTRCGRICLDRRKINLSTVFAGQKVGVKQVADQPDCKAYWTAPSRHVEPGPGSGSRKRPLPPQRIVIAGGRTAPDRLRS